MSANEAKLKSDNAGSLVWDLPLRIFHWALAVSLMGSWITAEAGFEWTQTHFLFGYTALGLISFRILWGLVGTTHARFRNFLSGPKAVIQSLKQLPKSTPANGVSHIGHGPLGGWASVVLLALVMTQAVSGLFTSDDIFYAGPYNSVVSNSLANYLGWLHHTNFNFLLAAVALHLLTVTWYLLVKKENLIRPMLTGRKNLGEKMLPTAIANNLFFRGLCIAGSVAAAVYLLVTLAPEPEYF